MVPVEGVHPDPVSEQRAAAAPPGGIYRQHRHPQLVLLVDPQPADQLVGQRGLAGPAGAGDTEHRSPAGTGRSRKRRPVRLGQRACLQAGDRPRQRLPLARQHRLHVRRPRCQVGVAVPDQLVDHPRQAEALAVLGREDPHPGLGQAGDLVRDDDPAAPAEDPHVPGPGFCQQLRQVLEVLDVTTLVGADRHALRVFLDYRIDDLANRPVMAQVHHLGTLRLQDAPHDVDRSVMPVEQRRRRHEPHRMHRHVQFRVLRRSWHSPSRESANRPDG